MRSRGLFLFAMLLTLNWANAQDEQILRNFLLDGKVKEQRGSHIAPKHLLSVLSPQYQFDMTGDGRQESLLLEFRDGIWIAHFYDFLGEKFYTAKFQSKGSHSRVFRVSVKHLSNKVSCLVFYFYEGANTYLSTSASAAIYLLTIDNKNLKTAQMTMGPSVWEEYSSLYDDYRRRRYDVEFKDFNRDGQDEIVVKSHGIKKVFYYQGAGKWLTSY